MYLTQESRFLPNGRKKLISRKLAIAAAREHFNVKKYRGDISLMGGNNPYYLFIYKGKSFEIR